MKKGFKNNEGGFIKWVVIFIILILIISYLGIDLRGLVESTEAQGNLGYVWGVVTNAWENYLRTPVLYLWNDIFIDILWESFVSNMEKIKDGQATGLETMVPVVSTTTPQ